ncbi:MAG: hypothetical protein ACREVL_02775 [Solimonas sp.]
MSLYPRGLALLLLFVATAALPEEPARKPWSGPYESLPSLGISREQAAVKIDNAPKWVKGASNVAAVESWSLQPSGKGLMRMDKRFGLTLKSVRDKNVMAVIRIPGVVPPEDAMLTAFRAAFTLRALSNVDPRGGWDDEAMGTALGSALGEATSPPYEPVVRQTGRNILIIGYYPEDNVITLLVAPPAVFEEYEDLDF